jgi:hypothetical protein
MIELLSNLDGHVVTYQSKDPVIWGGMEYDISRFVRFRVPDADASLAQHLMSKWTRWTAYSILEFIPEQDLFTVKMFSTVYAKDNNEGMITPDEVRSFLVEWGASVLPESTVDNILFKISAIEALDGKGFLYFGDQDDSVVFTELSYEPVEGVHIIEMDYSQTILSWNSDLKDYFISKDISVYDLDEDLKKLKFTASRTQLIKALELSVEQRFHFEASSGRYKVEKFIIDKCLCNSGFLELPQQELIIVDRLE